MVGHQDKPPVEPFYTAPTPEALEELREALATHYFSAQPNLTGAALERDIEDHAINRYRFTCRRWIPWISRFVEVPGARVIELGSGTGAITAAFGHLARSVDGFDIDEGSTAAANARARILGLTNTNHHAAPPERIGALVAVTCPEPVDIVSLYATLEHQTLEERQTSLRLAWDILRPGGVIVVGQTPNLLTYYHPHTSRQPFFDMLPDWVKFRYLDLMPTSRFQDVMLAHRRNGHDSLGMLLTRWGRGMSFHEFEIALGALRPIVAGHGFEPEILAFNEVTLEEKVLMTYVLEAGLDVPLAFCRRWLTLVLRKPVPGEPDPQPQFDPRFLKAPLVDRPDLPAGDDA